MKQLDCMTSTWVLVGISILKFSVDAAQNVKAYPLDEVMIFEKSVSYERLLSAKNGKEFDTPHVHINRLYFTMP